MTVPIESPDNERLVRPRASGDRARTRAKVAAATSLACLLGLALTASLVVGDDGFQRLDDRALVRLNTHDVGEVGSLSRFLAHLGEPLPQLVLLAAAVAIGLWRHRARLAVAAAILVGGADLTTQVLKNLITASRYQPIPGFVPIDRHSFPSGHVTATTAMTFAWVLIVPPRLRPAVGLAGAILTVLVGTAMVILHKHWPSDAVGGALVGAAWGFAVIAVLETLPQRGQGRRGQGVIPVRR